MSSSLRNCPWLVVGDFNAIRDPSDRVGSSATWLPSYDDFKDCLSQVLLEDLRFVGYRYTWSSSSRYNRKLKKIDKVLVNCKWCQDFSYSEVAFLDPRISDHTPMVVKITAPMPKKKLFKFFNFWMQHPSRS
ncbi:hypothetical protein BT93_L4155 [Corymbia citriodora subsp. variegata]|uniref:Endonuclease/exonuclease/phosphatase domain-containing protein n=1 Tax=Corymbia citriodora subsp. variegata TaxID=360336 RepID=A0A8T0CUM0_CORYI|nr:hypothetical protein BT93_L4155 [Corymbia citriodora subsp. variegata]